MPKKTAPRAPSYGDAWPEQGGIVVDFVPRMKGQPGWFLIAPTGPEAEAEKLAWGPRGVTIPGADSDWDGAANTKAMLASGKKCPIAEWAASLKVGGHRDFYVPSFRELRLLWARTPDLFQRRWYWSSSQYSADWAWVQLFTGGYQSTSVKGYEGRVRAVRRFLIT